MKKSRLIILLAAAFIAAGAGTVFVLTQINKPVASETQGEETAKKEEPAEQPKDEQKEEAEKAEEAQKNVDPIAAMQEKEKQEIALMNTCNKMREEMNKELEKEDRRHSDDMQKAYRACGGGACEEVEKENKKYSDNRKTIRDNYEKKWEATKCVSSL